MTTERTRILTIAEWYLPGYLAGGPVRTLANMVQRLSDRHEFWVLTRDRDQGAEAPYPGVRQGEWQDVAGARVRYLAPQEEILSTMVRCLRQVSYDVLYLNSFIAWFDIKVMLARRLGLIERRPLVIAPRGEFNAKALSIKAFKKRAYLTLSRLGGLWRDALFQASGEHELADIRAALGPTVPVRVAMDLAPLPSPRAGGAGTGDLVKESGRLRVLFLSRIARMKNLDGALLILQSLAVGEIEFDIYGPQEDAAYWQECASLMAALPGRVRAAYRGTVPGDKVGEVFSRYHVLLLPTHGENFGHVIAEALLAGCLTLISDRTPWRGLAAAGVGHDLSLDAPAAWTAAITALLDYDQQAFSAASARARAYGAAAAEAPEVLVANRALFSEALAHRD